MKKIAPACRIEGARTHNLKGISCRIPFGQMTAVTGVSGSGKSTLAFDVLYAEGQRRFVDCLSTYARQFLQRLDRPEVDHIGEIQPPVALRQQVSIRNARSTVGSITELSDLLHLLFAHGGTPHCPTDGSALALRTTESAAAELRGLQPDGRYVLTAKVRLPEREQGYTRVYRDGQIAEWSPPYSGGTHALVVDRFVPRSLTRSRALEAVEAAWRLGAGRAEVVPWEETEPVTTLIEGLSCPTCHERTRPLRPQLFSPNSPLGACPECNGFGRIVILDRDKVVPDASRTLAGGAVTPFETKTGALFRRKMLADARESGVPLDVPFRELTQAQKDWVFTGVMENGADETSAKGPSQRSAKKKATRRTGTRSRYRGVEGLFRRLERKRYRPHVRIFLARYRGYETCPQCRGSRLHPVALSVTLGGLDLAALETMPVRELSSFFEALRLSDDRTARVASVLGEIRERLGYLLDVGLGYLTLARTARTLSGGETQRIRLASGLGTSLTATLYILDEPTVGLHSTDTARMLGILRKLCESGNTVVVVEHDPGIVLHADHLIVLGPSGGEGGGELLYEGPTRIFQKKWPDFFRANVARDAKAAAGSAPGPAAPNRAIEIRGIRQHNLEVAALDIPTDRLVVVTGVSGSGKSTLLEDVVYRNALRFFGKPVEEIGRCEEIRGLDRFGEVLLVSQNPLGRSSRSTLISYIGLLAGIRTRLARTPRAKELGLRPRDFSFNVAGGRCETCKGMGSVVVEMHFLADVEVTCEVCRGKRFRADVLEVTDRGRSILQILDLTVTEALEAFAGDRDAVRCLTPLVQVGLDYLRLGQSTSTLSGGEAQRLKLAQLLGEGSAERRPSRGKSADTKPEDTPRVFLFDEPTSGLHPQDIRKLLFALRGLVRIGHAVIVVEHQLDFIGSADWVIDLGPGGGDEGGQLLYAGPVEGLIDVERSATGRSLREFGNLPRPARERVGFEAGVAT